MNEFTQLGVKVIKQNLDSNGSFDLKTILEYLASEKINSLLVEGGSAIFSSFINSGIYDEIVVLQAPVVFGKGVNSVKLMKEINLEIVTVEQLGKDIKILLKRNEE